MSKSDPYEIYPKDWKQALIEFIILVCFMITFVLLAPEFAKEKSALLEECAAECIGQ